MYYGLWLLSPEEAFCMTLLSESYYCVSSLLKLTMTFQMLYDPHFLYPASA